MEITDKQFEKFLKESEKRVIAIEKRMEELDEELDKIL